MESGREAVRRDREIGGCPGRRAVWRGVAAGVEGGWGQEKVERETGMNCSAWMVRSCALRG